MDVHVLKFGEDILDTSTKGKMVNDKLINEYVFF